MRALLLSSYKHLEMTEMPTPIAAADEVVIKVAACGICGSDVHGFDGSSGRRIPPIVMGHEAAGTVAHVGLGVSNFAEGDPVTFDSTVFCGGCEFCRRGEINLCDQRQVIGVSCDEFRRAGAFSEFVAVPARIVYPLPPGLSFPEAAMLEATSVALHAVHLSQIRGGETALIIGAGMIGLLTMQAARALGGSRIFVADLDATRLKLAEQLGADHTILGSTAELVREVARLTNGRGVDLVLEAVGREETVDAAVSCARKGGVVTLIGNIASRVTIPLQRVVTRQIRLQGSCGSAGEYPEAMRLIGSGEIRVAPLITVTAPLEEGPRWFERLYAREPNLMKVVLQPDK